MRISVATLLLLLFYSPPAFVQLRPEARALNVCMDIPDPVTLDPQKQWSEKNHTICSQMFDSLVRFSPDGKIEPALAVSWERIEPNRMRFTLRRGVVFHNGESFDSETVRFTIERYLKPETGFPARYFIEPINHAEIIDSHTVDIVTTYPDALLLNRFASLMFMVPPKYIKEKGEEYFSGHPVGTGAFKFHEWKKGEAISLSANREYWLKGFPKTDGLVFKFISYKDQLEALFSGKVDIITDLPGTQTLKVRTNPKLMVMKKTSFSTISFALRLDSGPLSNLDVRKALNHAVDKESLIRYDLLGNGIPIATFSMSGEIGHNSSLSPYEYNLEKAKKHLAKGGYPNGFSVKFLVKENAERAARIIAANLKKIGVYLDITLVSDADMIGEFKSGKYDISMGRCPDPMCHSYFVQSIVLLSGSPYAWGGDKKFDAMLSEMTSEVRLGESEKMAEAIDKYVYDNAMGIFNYQKVMVYGLDKSLHFTPYVTGIPLFFSAEFSGRGK